MKQILVSIVIPCYNEKNTILNIVKKIRKVKNIKKQIVLVDDCSTDGTKEIIKNNVAKYVDKVIYHKKNMGKGAAIHSSLKFLKGDIALIQDADLEYDPRDYAKLLKPIIAHKFLVVYGSRVLGLNRYVDGNFTSLFRVFANHALTTFSNIINNQNLTDAHTCYKVFHFSVLKKIKLQEKGFSFCPEITTKISNLGIEIKEVPISYYGRTVKDGKKISIFDGLHALFTTIKYKFF